MQQTELDVLIGTYRRPDALAVTLTSLNAQSFRDYRVVVSDQTEDIPSYLNPTTLAVTRVLALHHEVDLLHHLPRRGMAEQRAFLLSQATAPYVLYLDDDLVLEPDLLERLVLTMREQNCGFVGAGTIGLTHLDDVRPQQQAFEVWDGPVQPETVLPGCDAWRRHQLHSAANLLHVQQRFGLSSADRIAYKVAWVGACVLYDRAKLLDRGGFDFWRDLPVEHCGEDVLAQLRVMACHGGCGLLPTGVYHLQLDTTLPHREYDAPVYLPHLLPA